MDVAGASVELSVFADASSVTLPEPEPASRIAVFRGLNFIIDADVVQVLVMTADANDVAGLLNRGDWRRCPLPFVRWRPSRFHASEDVDLVAGAMGDLHIA